MESSEMYGKEDQFHTVFPTVPQNYGDAHDSYGQGCEYSPGLMLRDYFAAKAIVGILAGSWEADEEDPDDDDIPDIELYARDAYRVADAMLEARKITTRKVTRD